MHESFSIAVETEGLMADTCTELPIHVLIYDGTHVVFLD